MREGKKGERKREREREEESMEGGGEREGGKNLQIDTI